MINKLLEIIGQGHVHSLKRIAQVDRVNKPSPASKKFSFQKSHTLMSKHLLNQGNKETKPKKDSRARRQSGDESSLSVKSKTSSFTNGKEYYSYLSFFLDRFIDKEKDSLVD